MKSVSSVGLGLSIVFGCLLLALLAELYHLLWWKKRLTTNRDIENDYSNPAREFFYMFCWKRSSSSMSQTALNPQEISRMSTEEQLHHLHTSSTKDHNNLLLKPSFGHQDHDFNSLSGPPRFLFTIIEETREDLESEDAKSKSRLGSRGRSLSDLLLTVETPYLTPLASPPFFTPPLTPMEASAAYQGFNPLFESATDAEFNRLRSSPPPKFKFLQEAEEKLHRRKKMVTEEEQEQEQEEEEEEENGDMTPPSKYLKDEEDGSFITINVDRSKEIRGFHHNQQFQYSSSASSHQSQHASGKKFQEILKEAFIDPLKLDGELYIGIPPGVESRLASLTVDTDDLKKLSAVSTQLASSLPALFNMLNTRRAIIPAANGHCSARALARYYAALVDGGAVPAPHSCFSNPPLGSHPHIPKFGSKKTYKKQKGKSSNVEDGGGSKHKSNDGRYYNKELKDNGESYTRLMDEESNRSSITSTSGSRSECVGIGNRDGGERKIFSNPKIHDAFMGVGEYESLSLGEGIFGLGFRRFKSKEKEGCFMGFGHSGMGGSTGFCDIENRFAMAVTVNKMSFGGVTGKIIELVCSELNIPLPEELSLSGSGERGLDANRPLIN